MKRTSRLIAAGWVLIGVAVTGAAVAADGGQLLEAQCAGCHNLTGPAPTSLAQLWSRKGPDLFYAGNKYRREWLEEWLEKPVRIRPAGMFYGHHIKRGDEHDVIDASTLPEHPALSEADAKAVADALMERKAHSALIQPGSYQAGTISLSMGEMMFDKFRGCLACHRIEPGYGGVSGPEVYTVAQRLQADYLVSFLRNPRAWDPLTLMPAREMKDQDLQKFVHYFRALAEEESDD